MPTSSGNAPNAPERRWQRGTATAALKLAVAGPLLLVDGAPANGGVGAFAATHALTAYLRDAGLVEVSFAPSVAAEALLGWANGVLEREQPPRWPEGVRVRCAADSPQQADREPVAALHRRVEVAAQPDSRLRSVFLQHRLIDELPRLEGVEPETAKLVVQQVVDRLLQVPGGLDPLMLLQQDAALLSRSTIVAVLTVLFASRAGWPAERLADLGVAGLLHDLGTILDPDAPGPAAFRWLLERGDEDFWLRSALVARRFCAGVEASAGPAGPLAVVALVRLAAVAAASADPRPFAERVREVAGVPDELVEVAREALVCS